MLEHPPATVPITGVAEIPAFRGSRFIVAEINISRVQLHASRLLWSLRRPLLIRVVLPAFQEPPAGGLDPAPECTEQPSTILRTQLVVWVVLKPNFENIHEHDLGPALRALVSVGFCYPCTRSWLPKTRFANPRAVVW